MENRESIKLWNPAMTDEEWWSNPRMTAQMVERVEKMLTDQLAENSDRSQALLLVMDIRHLLAIAAAAQRAKTP